MKTISKAYYFSRTTEIPTITSPKDSYATAIDNAIPSLIQSGKEELFQVVTTPIKDKILITVILKGEHTDPSIPVGRTVRSPSIS